MIPIEIDGDVLDYPVTCKLAVEGIGIEPKSIDFGIIDVGYKSSSKTITIRNKGGKRTRYQQRVVAIVQSRGPLVKGVVYTFDDRATIFTETSAATIRSKLTDSRSTSGGTT